MSKELGQQYLQRSGGKSMEYKAALENNVKCGTAFFNALTRTDQDRIRLRDQDPYGSNDERKIATAINFLIKARENS